MDSSCTSVTSTTRKDEVEVEMSKRSAASQAEPKQSVLNIQRQTNRSNNPSKYCGHEPGRENNIKLIRIVIDILFDLAVYQVGKAVLPINSPSVKTAMLSGHINFRSRY